jgi:drug/metabolite transporter (DMT)-like permease
VIFGLVAALGWGLADFGGAVISRRIGSVPTVVISQASGAVVMAVVLVLGGQGVDALTPNLGWVLLGGIVAAAAYASHYRALQLGPVSVVSPIGAAYALVGVALAVVLLGERLSAVELGGAVVTVLGVMLASADLRALLEGTHERAPGLPLALLSALLFGVAGYILAWLSREVGWALALWASRTMLVVALALPASLVGRRAVWSQVTPGVGIVGAIAVGMADLLGVATYAAGAERGFVSVVIVASSVFPLIAVALSVLLLHERPVANQYVGVGLVVVGLLMLGLG